MIEHRGTANPKNVPANAPRQTTPGNILAVSLAAATFGIVLGVGAPAKAEDATRPSAAAANRSSSKSVACCGGQIKKVPREAPQDSGKKTKESSDNKGSSFFQKALR